MKEYKNYTLEDFLTDLDFQEWVLSGAEEQENRWSVLLQNAPWQEATMKEAKKLILAWRNTPPMLTEETKNQRIREILQATRVQDSHGWWIGQAKWVAAAAVIVLMIGIGYLWQQPQNRPSSSQALERIINDPKAKKIANHSPNEQEILLPDSSRVRLMPGAELTYHHDFEGGTQRDLELKGEAFFDVTQDKAHPFSVFTGAIVTRVLGTSFRIRSSIEEISVVVSSGKVKVFRADATADTNAEILLLPNQKVSFSPKKNELLRSLSDDPGILTDVQMLPNFNFDNTPLTEVLSRMEKAYGIPIKFQEESFKNCLLTAPLNGQSFYTKLDVICTTVKATYSVGTEGVTIIGKGCNPITNQTIP